MELIRIDFIDLPLFIQNIIGTTAIDRILYLITLEYILFTFVPVCPKKLIIRRTIQCSFLYIIERDRCLILPEFKFD